MTKENKQSKAVEVMMTTLNWAYDRVTEDIPGVGGAEELAADYLRSNNGDAEKAIDNLIGWQIGYAGTAGFITNLGGAVMMPIAIPANVASTILIQLRMVAAIAHLRGYNIREERVRTLAYLCLAGSSVADVVKDVGINFGVKLSYAMIDKIPGAILIKINKWIGFRLITKAGTRGVINLTKLLPIIGGVIGGGFDAAVTSTVASVAKSHFSATQETDDGDGNLVVTPTPIWPDTPIPEASAAIESELSDTGPA